jgi:PASTA domain-containing protein
LGDNDHRAHGWLQPDWDNTALVVAILSLVADLAQVDSLLGTDWPTVALVLAVVVAVTCVAARRVRTWTRPVLAVGLIAAAVCGLGYLRQTGADDTPVAAAAPGAPATRAQTATVTVVEPPVTTEPAPAVTPRVATGALAIPEGTVPDVVGMNQQEAQDLLRGDGFLNLHETDASGLGRLLVMDRNWVVVSQSVAAGSTVSLTTSITLSAVKIGE